MSLFKLFASKSLCWKYIVYVGVCLGIFSTGTHIFVGYQQYKILKYDFYEDLKHYSDFTVSLLNHTEQHDLQDTLNSLELLPDVSSISLRTQSAFIYINNRKEANLKYTLNTLHGPLTLEYSTAKLANFRNQIIAEKFSVTVVAYMALLILIIIGYQHFILKDVYIIRKYLNAEGILNRKYLSLKRNDEIGFLVEGYNEIVTYMKAQDRSIQDYIYKMTHDPATQLPNRVALMSYLETIPKAQRDTTYVIAFAVDPLKYLTLLGHTAYDEFVSVLAQWLVVCLKEDWYLANAGSIFLLVCNNPSEENPKDTFNQLIGAMCKNPIYIKCADTHLYFTITAGMAKWNTYTSVAALINQSIIAYYAAIQHGHGKGNFASYDSSMDAETRQTQMVLDLLNNVKLENIIVHFQPIVHYETLRIEGFELLTRLQSETELISPTIFIPIAEESGHIEKLAELSFLLAMQQIKIARWPDQIYLSVNIAPQDLHFDNIMKYLECAKAHGFATRRLRFEITESGIMRALNDLTDIVTLIRAAGAQIWMDDFGTGYSGLAELKRLDLDGLKVDRIFVSGHGSDDVAQSDVIDTVWTLCEARNLKCIIEGVETPRQAQELKHRCHYLQGFVFSPPIPIDTTIKMLRAEDQGHMLYEGLNLPRYSKLNGFEEEDSLSVEIHEIEEDKRYEEKEL